MSDLKLDGFKAPDFLAKLNAALDNLTPAERAAQIKKTAAIFELRVTNADKQEGVWTLDFKNENGSIYKGAVKAPAKAGVTLSMSDDTFEQLASGKLDGQKAFMTGKLKAKGNVILATRLGSVFEVAKGKAKL